MARQASGSLTDHEKDDRLLAIHEIVQAGLCIGCGLCQSIAGSDKLAMVLTGEGRERPVARTQLEPAKLALINAVCPGLRLEGASSGSGSEDGEEDLVWGRARQLAIGYAADPEIRHRGSTGGVLTALGQFLIASGRVKFILHVAASRETPFRSERRLSFDAASVLEGAGSRYGPAAPLIDFASILDRGEPFALIAKPCDVSAVRNLARHDSRVDRYMKYALALVCGGASDLTKSTNLLAEMGIEEDEVTLFRYRGYGNPGPTRIETDKGRSVEFSYQDMWEDEAKWRIQPRCKICPDAIGEAADLVASDVWPGCSPTGDDQGFNGVIVRTESGSELYEAALAAGVIAIEPRTVGFRDFDLYQPHQVRKKRAVWARFLGMKAAGQPTPRTIGLRLEACARLNAVSDNLAEARGARQRARQGSLGEPRPFHGGPNDGSVGS